MAWGRPRSCTCGTCQKCKSADYMRRWYASKTPEERREMLKQRNGERVRQYDRERYETRKNDPAYRAKERARKQLRYAVQRGEVVKQPCEVCGADEVQAHHDDYSKPLDVRWLCTTHHGEVHRLEDAA